MYEQQTLWSLPTVYQPHNSLGFNTTELDQHRFFVFITYFQTIFLAHKCQIILQQAVLLTAPSFFTSQRLLMLFNHFILFCSGSSPWKSSLLQVSQVSRVPGQGCSALQHCSAHATAFAFEEFATNVSHELLSWPKSVPYYYHNVRNGCTYGTSWKAM